MGALHFFAVASCLFSGICLQETKTIIDVGIVDLVHDDSGKTLGFVGEIDLGEVAAKAPVEIRFGLVNKTGKTVRLHSIQSSCSCLDVRVPVGEVSLDREDATNSSISIRIPDSMGPTTLGAVSFFADEQQTELLGTLRIQSDITQPSSFRKSHFIFL